MKQGTMRVMMYISVMKCMYCMYSLVMESELGGLNVEVQKFAPLR